MVSPLTTRRKGMKFKKIGSRKIYIEVIDQIKNLLDSGEIKPGDQLPSERDLAECMGISRVSVRQALAVLEALGIVEIRHGEGTFISLNKGNANNLDLYLSNLTKESDPLDIIDARKIIEVEIAGVAAIQRTEEDLISMKNLLSRMEEKIKQGEETSTVDLSFHLAITNSAHNPVLSFIMNQIASLMRQSLWSVAKGISLMTPGRADKYLRQHRVIYYCIERQDSLSAKEAMREHLLSIEKDLIGEGKPNNREGV